MLHSPGIVESCHRQVVSSCALGATEAPLRAVRSVNRRGRNACRTAALDGYAEGWAGANMDKIFDAICPSYRFSDPLVGSFTGRSLHNYFDILQERFSRTGTISKQDLAFFLRGPLQGSSDTKVRFWREAPLIGLSGVTEIEIGERGIIAERVAYDGNLASDVLRRVLRSSIDMNSIFSRTGCILNTN
jgi:hypothetical protein